MTSEQIRSIAEGGNFPGAKAPVKLIETHISWVILTPDFAFKIKKPVQFPFLDFSTAEKRAFFCHEELRLNRRLAPDMYLQVLPISRSVDGFLEIKMGGNGPAIDSAICMKRMDDSRQMDKLLLKNEVSAADMADLARVLARFHRTVVIVGNETQYRAGDHQSDFDDLFRLETECLQLFGAAVKPALDGCREKTGWFLKKHEPRLHARAQAGFWVEGHGDLHGRNIFLLPGGPVVFDCIEFNPHFRRLDVLSELAFLCMDLDAGGHHELEKAFMDAYLSDWKCIENREDAQLFKFFKTYRANVRLKIALLEWQQHPSEAVKKTAGIYWRLMLGYLAEIGG